MRFTLPSHSAVDKPISLALPGLGVRKLNIVEKWQIGLLGTLLFRTCHDVEQGMLTHRLLINHHRKRSTI